MHAWSPCFFWGGFEISLGSNDGDDLLKFYNTGPAWTDRILYKGDNVSLHFYGRNETMKISDHRAVRQLPASTLFLNLIPRNSHL